MSYCSDKCLYCEGFLSPRHEHDHFPVPERHGGDEKFCVCVNCHDLKDRIDFDAWPASAKAELTALWPKLSPIQRIMLAKMHALSLDAKAVLSSSRTTA